jgi:hypothetical protein
VRLFSKGTEFEVLIAAIMKSSLFLDAASCSLVEVTEISEESTATVFRVIKEAKQEASKKQAADSVLLFLR